MEETTWLSDPQVGDRDTGFPAALLAFHHRPILDGVTHPPILDWLEGAGRWEQPGLFTAPWVPARCTYTASGTLRAQICTKP